MIFRILSTQIAFIVIWSAFQSMIFFSSTQSNSLYLSSILMTLIFCIVIILTPVHHRGALRPPLTLGLMTLVFFPLFSLFYLFYPDLGKWYSLYFSTRDIFRNSAAVCAIYGFAFMIFVLGFFVSDHSHERAPLVESPKDFRGKSVLYLLVLFGLSGMILYAFSLGGFKVVLEEMSRMESRRDWRETGSGPFYYIGMLLMTAPPVLFLKSFVQSRKLSSLIIPLLLLLLSTVVLLASQASREKAIFPIVLTMLSTYLLVHSTDFRAYKRPIIIFSSVLLISVLAAFAVQTGYRWASRAYTSDISMLKTFSDFNRMDISLVMFFEYFGDGSRNDLLYGTPMLSYFNQIAVRLFDAAPILNTSAILHQFIFKGDLAAGYPGAPLAGELFLNFGYLGVFLFFPIGMLFGRSYRRLILSDYDHWRCIFFAAHTYFFMVKVCIYIGLSESILMMGVTYIPLYFLQSLTTSSKRTASSALKIGRNLRGIRA